MNLLQLLGICRQAGSQRWGAKAVGEGGGPTLLPVTPPPCDSDVGLGPANTNAPQRQTGTQGSGLSPVT